MKKVLLSSIAAVLLGTGLPVFVQKATVYISPNNDGVQDELTVPLSITDKRYIKEWNFIITDENGTVVRTIGNKVRLPEKLTFKTFFSRLFAPKQGVDVPSSVTWDGTFDSGEIAPDGTYYYYFTASDDNNNTSSTNPLTVIVDNTPPAVSVRQPDSEADKIFGEGSKAIFPVEQTGSVEDTWTAAFYDTAGNPVRTYTWSGTSPEPLEWDGRNDDGQPVSDGVYYYRITAIDRAGNTAPVTGISNIIYSAEKPGTNIALAGSRYFSPNGDGVQDSMVFDLTIPSGSATGGNRLVSWAVSIINTDGNTVRSFTGTDTAPQTLLFDGKDSNRTVLPDGSYQAVVTASYLNGFEPSPIRSPVFVLDNTPPMAAVKASSSIFSPDGDGRIDTIEFVQDTSKEKNWTGEIRDKSGKAVRSYTLGSRPAASVTWDGLADDGTLCPDGFYTYRLFTQDEAGNSASAETVAFELNTGTTEVILTVQPMAFSPNGDNVQETVTLTPVVKTESGVSSYELQILNNTGMPVKTIKDNRSLPARFTWNGLADDGTRCPDGQYTAVLATVSKNGSLAETSTQPFTLDTVYPEVVVEVPYTLFSPDGDGNKDTIPFTITASRENIWIGTIRSGTQKVIREYRWEGRPESFTWDGTDESGNQVADGTYSFTISATDAAGNTGSAVISGITVDTRAARVYLTASTDMISPNGDGFKDTQTFTIRTTLNEGIERWQLNICNSDGSSVKSWSEKDRADVPATVIWDGITNSGRPAEGTFTAQLDIAYTKGNTVHVETTPFISSVTPPQLTVQTAPRYFSPDNDGVDDDLFIALKAVSSVPLKDWSFTVYDPQNGNVFWSRSGTSTVTERMVWDGRGNNGELVQSATDYPFTFKVTDSLGMESEANGIISVDVLVIRIGDVLKIQVPSIIFRSDNADFKGKDVEPENGLEQSVIDNNIRVIRRIAEILNKFKDYTVRIEGHANNVTGTEEEETSTENGNIPLVPLSEARAETVKNMLIEFGVDSSRLSTVGMGGRQPVVPREDRDNWWKNRRVEFILNK